MKKIRSEFLTESEATAAAEKINPYCGNVRIIYHDENFNQGHDYYSFIPYDSFYGFPEMGTMNFGGFGGFGGFGMTSSLNHNPYLGYTPSMSGRTTLEAEAADDNFEYVKDRLYAMGAVTVTHI